MIDEKLIKTLKTNIISIGRLLWEKDLATGLNGNVSVRVDQETILLTAHGTCLGLLTEHDILLLKLNGELLEQGKVSTEKLLHTEIYKNFSAAKAVLHSHTTYTNAFFLRNEIFEPSTFEAQFTLGKVQSIVQETPSVTDAAAIIEHLKNNNIVVLKNHGVVAMGENLFDCFLLIQGLEEQVKIDAISRLYVKTKDQRPETRDQRLETKKVKKSINKKSKKYKLFSKEQISEIVRLVNDDKQMQELGTKTQMNMDLAVKLNETGDIHSFKFNNGRIIQVAHDADAEFLISAPEKVWRAVFNREIDPFVATTQKKMDLRGDFARISKWYAPCSRIFQLWQEVPVE